MEKINELAATLEDLEWSLNMFSSAVGGGVATSLKSIYPALPPVELDDTVEWITTDAAAHILGCSKGYMSSHFADDFISKKEGVRSYYDKCSVIAFLHDKAAQSDIEPLYWVGEWDIRVVRNKELARALGVTLQTIYVWKNRGWLPHGISYHKGDRTVGLLDTQVDQAMKTRPFKYQQRWKEYKDEHEST